MKTRFLILISTLIFLQTAKANTGDEQNKILSSKHSLGLQVNPYFPNTDAINFDLNRFYLRGALRYGYKLNSSVTVGAEMISTYDKLAHDQNFFTIGTGIYGRYWFLNTNWVRLGAEINGFGVRQNFHSERSNTGFDHFFDFYRDKYKFGYFISPVISLNKPSSRWSVDLMYKFSHLRTPAYYDKAIFSYRLSYHF
jgi:hypothetical protein